MNKKQIEEILVNFLKLNEKHLVRKEYDEREEFEFAIDMEDAGDIEQIEGFEIALEEQFGGEGMGEDYWAVYKLLNKSTQEAVFIKFSGFYESYDGASYEDPNEFEVVEPRMVEVRKWFKKEQ